MTEKRLAEIESLTANPWSPADYPGEAHDLIEELIAEVKRLHWVEAAIEVQAESLERSGYEAEAACVRGVPTMAGQLSRGELKR